MTPDGLAEKLILAIRRWLSACQELLYRSSNPALERSPWLQVMHHPQRHGLVALLCKAQRQAARAQAERGIEHWRQGNAVTAVTHRPAIVVMQVVGVAEHRGRLPLQAFKGLGDSVMGTDMVRVRVD